MKKLCIVLFICLISNCAYSQQAYFVDGYHGGIYGHYPVEWKTQFIVDRLAQHPEWRICLEIEPETWDTVRVKTPEAYEHLKKVVTSPQVEFTNPTYAQPYCYNISGESLIRQFEYGIKKIHAHFPQVEFVTYSVEEPCFTSCLPQILKLFGFKYAVLKCPNTCWGGYTNAYGSELVNWVGTDGTSILTVPRYACEQLEKNSTWQTTAWCNEDTYLKACREAGIKHPVGMCLQDAGWKNGPWLGSGKKIKNKSVYTTWKNYFEHISVGKTSDNWHFTQEDVQVNLMWGSQVLQKIAQEVRVSENKIVMAEKMAAMAHLENGFAASQAELDEAWRTLMMAQHHDSWIVPYNRLNKHRSWAEEITLWTGSTDEIADRITHAALRSFESESASAGKEANTLQQQRTIRVYNTLGVKRTEVVCMPLSQEFTGSEVELRDWKGKEISCSVEREGEKTRLLFEAEVPPFGYSTYRVQAKRLSKETVSVTKKANERECVVENDMYKIVFDASKGGIIKSLIAKKEGNKEFARQAGQYALGELRGFFYEEGKFRSSTEVPATISMIEDNSFRKRVKIEGEIASHPFTQIVTLEHGQKRIDFNLTIHWKNNVGIGEYKETSWRDNRRSYCDDRFKLSILFPVALDAPRISKNAPLDVCESRLDNTFFNTWDGIKHNIILHWVDLAEEKDGYALALLSDHTTTYSHGKDYPLGLTAQYSGGGLWGPDYRITRPLEMKYALIPHKGKWDKAAVSTDSDCWNEPLMSAWHSSAELESKSFIDFKDDGYQISAAKMQDGALLLRLFNAGGDEAPRKVSFSMPLSGIEEIDLNGNLLEQKKIKVRGKKTEITVAMPRFGIKTFLLKTM